MTGSKTAGGLVISVLTTWESVAHVEGYVHPELENWLFYF